MASAAQVHQRRMPFRGGRCARRDVDLRRGARGADPRGAVDRGQLPRRARGGLQRAGRRARGAHRRVRRDDDRRRARRSCSTCRSSPMRAAQGLGRELLRALHRRSPRVSARRRSSSRCASATRPPSRCTSAKASCASRAARRYYPRRRRRRREDALVMRRDRTLTLTPCMATRDDVLAELGLLPRWRLRAPAAHRRPASRPEPEDRLARIATAAVERVRRGHRAVHGVRPVPHAPQDGPRRRRHVGGMAVRRRGARRRGRRARRALRRPGGTPARQHARGARPGARRATCTSRTCSSAGRPTTARPSRCEVEACRPYLERQIELIAPEAHRRARPQRRVAAARHRRHDREPARPRASLSRASRSIVTYHPAYLLRNLPDKAKAWEDLLLARATVAQSAAIVSRRTSLVS